MFKQLAHSTSTDKPSDSTQLEERDVRNDAERDREEASRRRGPAPYILHAHTSVTDLPLAIRPDRLSIKFLHLPLEAETFRQQNSTYADDEKITSFILFLILHVRTIKQS